MLLRLDAARGAVLRVSDAATMARFWRDLGHVVGPAKPVYRTERDLPADPPYDPVVEAKRERVPRQRSLGLGALTKQAEAQQANRELRLRLIARFGGCCKDCGIVGPPAIYQFDHRDPFTKARNVSACRTWEEALAEAEKCDLVCCNCHAIRTQGDARIGRKLSETARRKRESRGKR